MSCKFEGVFWCPFPLWLAIMCIFRLSVTKVSTLPRRYCLTSFVNVPNYKSASKFINWEITDGEIQFISFTVLHRLVDRHLDETAPWLIGCFTVFVLKQLFMQECRNFLRPLKLVQYHQGCSHNLQCWNRAGQ